MEYIKNFTDHLVQQSWQIAVLFLIVAVGSFLLRNKSSHWRYLLWCVILAKCLLPPVMTFKAAVLPNDVIQDRSVVGYPASDFRNQTSDVRLKFQEPKNNSQTISNNQNSKLDSRFRGNDGEEIASSSRSGTPRNDSGGGNDTGIGGANRRHYAVMDYIKEHFHILVFVVWGVGAFAFLIVAGVKAFLLNRWILRHRQRPGEDVSGEIEKLKSTVSSEFRSRIWVVEKITQPFVWGLWRGNVYLPAKSKNSADVIMHELAHIIRLDAFVNLLQIFAQAIFWFHPFVWIANNRIRAEREKSCDEIAIARLKISPRSYSSAVVDVLVREYQARKALPSLAVAGPVKNIEERIRTIMAQGKKFYSRPTAAAVITVLILAAIFVPTTIAITKAEPEKLKATENTEGTEGQKVESTSNNTPAGQDANGTGKIENVDVYVEDFDISPYEAGGLYTVTAKIGNHGTVTAPSFSMNFFSGDPKDNLNLHGKPQSGSYGAGPIKPEEFFNEQSSPFALEEGRNVVFVVLDSNNEVAEVNETNNQAMLMIVVKDGKIVEKTFCQSAEIVQPVPTTSTEWYEQLLSKNVTVDIDKSPDGNRLTVQYAVIAVCEAAGVPYKWDTSAKLAEPQRRSFIEPLHIKDTPAREAITNILKPIGLNYAIDSDGLFIYKNQEPVRKEVKR